MGQIPSKIYITTLDGKRFQRMPLVQQFLVSHFHQIRCGSILAYLNPLSTLLDLFLALNFIYVKFHTSYMICVIGVIESSSLLSQSQGIQSQCLTSSKMALPLPSKLNFLPNSTYDAYGQVYQPYNSSNNIQASHGFKIARGRFHVAQNFQLVWVPWSPCVSMLHCHFNFLLYLSNKLKY